MVNLEGGEQTSEPRSEAPKTSTLKLVDLKSFNLPSGPNVREADDDDFLRFASSVVGLGEHWAVEARRDFINWALREGLVELTTGENEANLIRIKNSGKNSVGSSVNQK